MTNSLHTLIYRIAKYCARKPNDKKTWNTLCELVQTTFTFVTLPYLHEINDFYVENAGSQGKQRYFRYNIRVFTTLQSFIHCCQFYIL